MHCASRLPVLMLLACLGAAASASANQVVILNSGNRLEVESALPVDGTAYHLKLVGGGTLVLPAGAVRRVSNAAADLPRQKAPMIASSSGAWQPSPGGSTSASGRAIPAGIPAGAIREMPGRFQPARTPRAPGLAPGAFADDGGNTSSLVSPRALPDGMGASPALRSPQSVASQARSSRPVAGDFRRSMSRGHGSGGSVRAFGSPASRPMGGDPGKSPGLPRLSSK